MLLMRTRILTKQNNNIFVLKLKDNTLFSKTGLFIRKMASRNKMINKLDLQHNPYNYGKTK